MDDRQLADREDTYHEPVDGTTVDVANASAAELRELPIVRLFVLQVVLWNLIILAASVGLLLIYTRDDWTIGGLLIGATVVLLLYSVYRWRRRPDDGLATRQ